LNFFEFLYIFYLFEKKKKGFDGEYIYKIDNKTSRNLFFNDEMINTGVNNYEISKDLGKLNI